MFFCLLQSSTEAFGLQRKMVHSIASLVNPHAKLAESEAKRLEQEYREKQNPTPVRSASQLSRRAVGSAKSMLDFDNELSIFLVHLDTLC